MIQNYKRINFFKNILNIKKKKHNVELIWLCLTMIMRIFGNAAAAGFPKNLNFFFTKI